MALEDKARGQRIAALRKRTPGLTQQLVAERLKVGYRTVQSWESGAVVPEWPNVERMAKFFKVRPEEIMGELPPMEPKQLDRIEAKLDQLLMMLSDNPESYPDEDAERALEEAADAAERQWSRSEADQESDAPNATSGLTRPGRRRAGQAR